MEDKVIEAINHARNKNKEFLTKERIFYHITKTKALTDQSQLMEAFRSGVIFNKEEENENLILLLIRITIHGSLGINHQQK